MRQAAAEGIIDFRDADPADRWWWRKLRWMLDYLEQRNGVLLEQMYHTLQCCGLDAMLGREALESYWGRALDSQHRVHAVLFPWYKVEGRPETARKSLAQTWNQVFGPLDDPKTQEKIRLTLEGLKAIRQGKNPGR